MDQTKASARRWFDRRAGSYESDVTSRWRDPVQRASLGALELTDEDRLLDVGCGTGAASRAAGATARSVVGIDLSLEMTREASRSAGQLENVSASRSPTPSDFRSATRRSRPLCSNSFHHYPNPFQAVREMARVLVPGGRLVIGDACADLATARIADRFLRRFEPGHVRLYASSELGSFLHQAGFSGVVLRRLSGGGFAIVRGVIV